MGFEVPPTRVVSRRTAWSALPVVVVALAIAAVGFASKGGQSSPPPLPTIVALASGPASPEVTDRGAQSAAPTPTDSSSLVGPFVDDRPVLPVAPALRARLVCSVVDRPTCTQIAAAAIRLLPSGSPAVRTASVWSSLLCDSSLDCPPSLLRSVVPVGSAVLVLEDGGPPVWVNVVGRPEPADPAGLQLEAWIVRS